MNNYLLSFILSLVLCSCNKATQSQAVPVDTAKVEQLKKLLAEQKIAFENSPADKTGATAPTLDPNRVVGIKVTPSSLNLIEGLDTAVSVTAVLANGQDLSLSDLLSIEVLDPKISSMASSAVNAQYTVKALTPGRTTIKVVRGEWNVSFELLVKPKELVSIEVFPKSIALGTPTRFKLLALYNNASKAELSSGVQWESMSPSFINSDAQSVNTGVFTGSRVGAAGVRASYAGQTIVSRTEVQMPQIRSIQVVSEVDSFLLGAQAQLKAMATFISGSSYDITSSVAWSSADPSIISVNAAGEVDALFPGDVQIAAKFGNVSGAAGFFVTSISFQSYRISAITASVPAGLTTQLRLFGVKSDGSEMDISAYARWSSLDTQTAQSGTTMTPKQPGVFLGVALGTTTITARYGTNSRTATLTVTDAVVIGLNLTNDNPTGVCGVNVPLMRVEGVLSDGNSKDLTALATYTIDPPEMAIPHTDPAKKGYIVTIKPGAAKVKASYTELTTNLTYTATLPISSTAAIRLGTGITAAKLSVAYGESLALKSSEILSCGTGLDFTLTSSWLTDNESPPMNTVLDAALSKGVLNTLDMVDPPTTSSVTMKVSAIKGSLRSDANIVVRPKEMQSITVIPDLADLDVRDSTLLNLTARYSDGSTVIIDDIANFPGYSVQFAVADCVEVGCATVLNSAIGSLKALSKEGIVKVYASLSTPQGYSLLSAKIEVNIQSKCALGQRAGLYCIFQGARGKSCTQACAAVAGGSTYNDGTSTLFGKDGLSVECNAALISTGYTRGLQTTSSVVNLGVGCSVWTITALNTLKGYYDKSITTTAAAVHPDYARVCACNEP
ncbi:MAG: Ig-like domain-containing protein [Oligoflexus sp.]|nr:Ig-like domain-containing protein [Oligoflexus sp.]